MKSKVRYKMIFWVSAFMVFKSVDKAFRDSIQGSLTKNRLQTFLEIVAYLIWSRSQN